ncbi:ABC-2 type transport system permease protein [Leucobacter luti]|uniref:ABC-2 type transport system permease protein n=2 Tax=Leucobacter luti TaxID=340320 RepID=A0A4Q7TIV9_9MICO|nr:ABC transporter permease [Leucobacter luti]RZT60586.1 ABC-2 type transport system permease protein [Leucobacter luti]
MRAVIMKEFRELARDRRTLAMLVVFPVILLIVFGYAANFAVDRVSVVIVGADAQALADSLAESSVADDELDVLRVAPELTAGDGAALLRAQEANAVLVAKPGAAPDAALADRMHTLIDGSSLFTAQAAQGVVVKLAAEDAAERMTDVRAEVAASLSELEATVAELEAALTRPPGSGAPPTLPTFEAPEIDAPTIEAPEIDADEMVTVLFNPDLKTSWVLVPGLIGLILLFIGAMITSIGLVRERETGTLEQLAVMPLRPSAIIMGKITPYFVLALLDMAVVTLLGMWLFALPFEGSVLLFGAASVIFLFVVLGIGVFISSVSQSTGQAIQIAILFVVPQVLLSGLIFPLESMPLGVRWIGYALPLTWFRDISQGVMLRGADLESLWLPLTVLTGMAVLAFGAATARMRYSLTHGGTR